MPVLQSVPRHLVPGPASAGVDVLDANNNLDVVRWNGRIWLAWRTAPTHFASAAARLHLVVSDDGGSTWRHDHTVEAGRDVREPRLVSWQGRLLWYWFTAGTRGTAFEPDRIHVSERGVDARWSEPLAISPPDCVVWRVRPIGGRLAMSLYRGAGALYTSHPVPLTVELWASDDGITWEPFDPGRPVVHHGGSETEFIELGDGTVLSAIRKEGPSGGWGSDIGRSAPGNPSRWRLRPDARKFDSPLLFLAGERPILVTRRHLANHGRFDLGLGTLGPELRTRLDHLAYWATPKRTAAYEIDPDQLSATWLCDLPSAGDTAFAAQVPLAPGRHLIANYSSPLSRGWWPWMVGQLRPTHIHALEIDFS